MLPNEFDREVARLRVQFGDKLYSQEFAKLLWREVKDHSYTWFKSTCDEFIGSRRLLDPPLIPDFRDAIARNREQSVLLEKKQHTQEIYDEIRALTRAQQSDHARAIRQYLAGGSIPEDQRLALGLKERVTEPTKSPGTEQTMAKTENQQQDQIQPSPIFPQEASQDSVKTPQPLVDEPPPFVLEGPPPDDAWSYDPDPRSQAE